MWKATLIAGMLTLAACTSDPNETAFVPTPGVKMDWQAVNRDAETWAKAKTAAETIKLMTQAQAATPPLNANPMVAAEGAKSRAMIDDWGNCVAATAYQMLDSAESADIILRAAFAACSPQEERLAQRWRNMGSTPLQVTALRAQFRQSITNAVLPRIVADRVAAPVAPPAPKKPAPEANEAT